MPLASPRLGVVLLDEPHLTGRYGDYRPTDRRGLGAMPAGFFESPNTWCTRTTFCVADGVTDLTDPVQLELAGPALQAAVDRLSPKSDVIITDCGLFYRLRGTAVAPAHVSLRLSGLEYVEAALHETDRRVAILTLSAHDLSVLWSSLPQVDRLDIIELDRQPTWQRLAAALTSPDYPSSWPDWPAADLQAEAIKEVTSALSRTRGDIGAIVVECTFIVQFAAIVSQICAIPVFDVTTGHDLLARRHSRP